MEPLFQGAPASTSEPKTSSTLEICDDILDNDLDGKIDVEDEECLSTTPLNKQLAPEVQDGQDSQDSREEEQQSEGDDEDNANNDEDNEDEDEDNDNED